MNSNFDFLSNKFPILYNIGNLAEKNLYNDPSSTIIKLRLFAEKLTFHIFDISSLQFPSEDNLNSRLKTLKFYDAVPEQVLNILYRIKNIGNKAVHEGIGNLNEASELLETTFKLALWFIKVYGQEDIKDINYKAPIKEDDYKSKVLELEKQYNELEEKFKLLETTKEKVTETKPDKIQELKKRAYKYADTINLSESETRKLIDEKLRQAGWEADTENLDYRKGVRPEKSKNKAISEFPTGKLRADYALFKGLELIALVEAKKKNKDIISDLRQAKDYAKEITESNDYILKGQWEEYKVPFIFSTNGRPYIKQLESKSGICFLDLRKSTNHPKILQSWYSPQGLQELFETDYEQANDKLQVESFDYLKSKNGLNLREYQIEAIEKIEEAIINGQSNILVAMATGTGKTKTIIGLVYRLLKSKRFKRILFLVDRNSLGQQTIDSFKETTIEQLLTFDKIYEIKGLKEKVSEIETKVQIATVQSMVKRIFYSDEENIPSVDTYDCIVIDEAHRGYILDKEISEEYLEFKNEDDYIGKYRKVIDYFDSVKIALTATPALHTVEIFGHPVFRYPYRRAVTEGYLIDHEPPYQIKTKLNQEGIQWKVGDTVKAYDTQSNEVFELDNLSDELDFDVSSFNNKVITENFNRTVISQLINYLDPSGWEKTLVFAANDVHADMIVKIFKEEFEKAGIEIEDDAIEKITGTSYNPQELIKKFKNEKYPNIAVTVDLLTTGIDVPKICNLVFLRRVRSRILYEQMLGRATRRADDIGKDHFKIFDAVGIYELMQDFTDMKPVVTNPKTTITGLIEEFEKSDEKHKSLQVDEILAKIQRIKRKVSSEEAEAFSIKSNGLTPDEFIKMLRTLSKDDKVKLVKEKKELFTFFDELKGIPKIQLISEHEDQVINVERGYGNATKPEDYIQGFKEFIKNNMNEIPALQIVVQRPKELTRKELKNLKYELDKIGYSELALNTAWKELKNEEIVADIISFIRQQALGSSLISHEERIKRAVNKVKGLKSWTKIQLGWLERIEKQLLRETVIDKESFDSEPFKSEGGYNRINKLFNNELDNLIGLLNDYLYIDKDMA